MSNPNKVYCRLVYTLSEIWFTLISPLAFSRALFSCVFSERTTKNAKRIDYPKHRSIYLNNDAVYNVNT